MTLTARPLGEGDAAPRSLSFRKEQSRAEALAQTVAGPTGEGGCCSWLSPLRVQAEAVQPLGLSLGRVGSAVGRVFEIKDKKQVILTEGFWET